MKRFKINVDALITWIVVVLAVFTLWFFMVYVVMNILSCIW